MIIDLGPTITQHQRLAIIIEQPEWNQNYSSR